MIRPTACQNAFIPKLDQSLDRCNRLGYLIKHSMHHQAGRFRRFINNGLHPSHEIPIERAIRMARTDRNAIGPKFDGTASLHQHLLKLLATVMKAPSATADQNNECLGALTPRRLDQLR